MEMIKNNIKDHPGNHIEIKKDENQLVGAICRAADENKRIETVGATLSWSDIIDMPQVAIR